MVTEQKTSISMVIVKKLNLWKLIDNLKANADSQQFLILKSGDELYEDFFFVIYEAPAQLMLDKYLKFTVVHKKGRCYYTINALNAIVCKENNGVLDKLYLIDWLKYQNMILFMNRDKELIQLNTRLYKIIKK